MVFKGQCCKFYGIIRDYNDSQKHLEASICLGKDYQWTRTGHVLHLSSISSDFSPLCHSSFNYKRIVILHGFIDDVTDRGGDMKSIWAHWSPKLPMVSFRPGEFL